MTRRIFQLWRQFHVDPAGDGAIEYALIAAVTCLLILAVVGLFGPQRAGLSAVAVGTVNAASRPLEKQ